MTYKRRSGSGTPPGLTAVLAQSGDGGNQDISNVRNLSIAGGGSLDLSGSGNAPTVVFAAATSSPGSSATSGSVPSSAYGDFNVGMGAPASFIAVSSGGSTKYIPAYI